MHTSSSTQSVTPSPAAPTAGKTTSKGNVTLVGAGPGDPDLLTLKAVHAIGQASVILVDDLVGDAVLAHAQPSARIVYVGKRGGCKSTPQAEIDALMVREAQLGEQVVRLKGGDPLLFGRAGEEMAALSRAGIAYQVVGGMTAGLAAAQSLQLSLTHRDHARGVLFVTGHAQQAGQPPDWRALGKMAMANKITLLIYMGIAQIESIAAGLGAHMPADTPVAVVQGASTGHEIKKTGTLGALVALIDQYHLQSPSVIIVGAVVGDVLA